MKKGVAKEKIMAVAIRMFKKEGYGSTYVNKIASEAGVSIGTLYYHFPQGKLSIFREMGTTSTSNYIKNLQKYGFSIENEYNTISEALFDLIFAIVKIHEEERDFILALEVEFLSKLEEFLKIKENLTPHAEIKTQTELFLRPIRELLKKFPNEALILDGKENKVFKVIDTLVHRHTFINDTFGTEDEFVEMMTKIILTLLKSDN